MRFISAAFAILSWFSAAGQPSGSTDIVHYAFYIELADSTDAITGRAEILVRFRESTSLIELDLAEKNRQKGMKVSAVMVNGAPAQYSHERGKLGIRGGEYYQRGTKANVVVRYSGTPADGLIITRNKFGDRTFFSDNWPNRAHHWLPVVDHPSDKATVEFIVTAPVHYSVIANGAKIEESALDGHRKLTHWKEERPIPVKVMVIGAARFAIRHEEPVKGIAVEHWVYPQNRADGFHDFSEASAILSYFIELIGPYPYRKLANVQSKTRYGGMENASAIFYHENSVNGRGDNQSLIAHEIAHQWFGDSAGELDWHHVWLSEGFATYLSHLYNEYKNGPDAMRTDLATDREAVVAFNRKNPLPVVWTSLPAELTNILNKNSYQRGSWVLHMLRRKLGDATFRRGLAAYYETFRDSVAVTADFQLIMEKVSGQDLGRFFEQWLFRPQLPKLASSWKYDEREGTVRVAVEQEQAGPVFDLDSEVSVQLSDNQLIVNRFRISERTAAFSVKCPVPPRAVVLDPDVNLLFEAIPSN